MNEDILDIYGDLDEVDREAERKATEEAIIIKDKEIKVLTEKSDVLQKELEKLKQENLSVKKNFYSYMETSRRELERRNKDVTALRKQKDDLLFKRNQKGDKVTNKIDRAIQVEEQINEHDILKTFIEKVNIKKFETKTTQTENVNDKTEKLSREVHYSRSSSNDYRSKYISNDSKRDRKYDYHRSSSRRSDSSSYSRYSKSSRDSRHLNDVRNSSSNLKRKRDSKSTEKSSVNINSEKNCSNFDKSKSSNTAIKSNIKPNLVDNKTCNDLEVNEILHSNNAVILDENMNKENNVDKENIVDEEKVVNIDEKPTIDIQTVEKTEILLEVIDSSKKTNDLNDDSKNIALEKSLDFQSSTNSSNSRPCINEQSKSASIKRKRDSISSEKSCKQLKVETELTDKEPDTEFKSTDMPEFIDDQLLIALNLNKVIIPESKKTLHVNVKKEIPENINEGGNNDTTDTDLDVVTVEEKLNTESTVQESTAVVKVAEKTEVPLSVTDCVKILLAQVSDNSSDDEIYPIIIPKKPSEKMNILAVYNEADDDTSDVSSPKKKGSNNENINKLNIENVKDQNKDSINITEKSVVKTPVQKSKKIIVLKNKTKPVAKKTTKCTNKNSTVSAKKSIKTVPSVTASKKDVPNKKIITKIDNTNEKVHLNGLSEDITTNNINNNNNNNLETKIDTNHIKEISIPENTDNLNKTNEKQILLSPTSSYVIETVSNKVVNVIIKRKTSKMKRKSTNI